MASTNRFDAIVIGSGVSGGFAAKELATLDHLLDGRLRVNLISSDLPGETLDPTRRTLMRVTMADALQAEKMFRMLMGDEVEPRRKFIEDNALNVQNLDI